MELREIVDRHLTQYVASGAPVMYRLSFLINLFREISLSGFDVFDSKEYVTSRLKLPFAVVEVSEIYDMCITRDINRAVSLSVAENIPEPKKTVLDPDDMQPDDVPEIDREAVKNRVAVYDQEFLDSIGYVKDV